MQQTRHVGSIPELGRSPEGGNGNPVQDSCLENPMDREAWWATVHGVAEDPTRLKRLSTHSPYTQKDITQPREKEIFPYATTWMDLESIILIEISQSVRSVAQSYPTLCHPTDCNTPGYPVHHRLPELAQTHVHWVSDAIQPSHPLSSPSPPVFHLSQH